MFRPRENHARALSGLGRVIFKRAVTFQWRECGTAHLKHGPVSLGIFFLFFFLNLALRKVMFPNSAERKGLRRRAAQVHGLIVSLLNSVLVRILLNIHALQTRHL